MMNVLYPLSKVGKIALYQCKAFRKNMDRIRVKSNVFRLGLNPKKFGLLLEKGMEKD
ncbi:hypothetical protein ACIQZD_15015 [Peribacillus sp. NPDC096447]|uniref:hypothetical protein n=1 Tax=Peribacillus sp. NPDC096447 TaxID=3364394 RepID=UPI00380FE30B